MCKGPRDSQRRCTDAAAGGGYRSGAVGGGRPLAPCPRRHWARPPRRLCARRSRDRQPQACFHPARWSASAAAAKATSASRHGRMFPMLDGNRLQQQNSTCYAWLCVLLSGNGHLVLPMMLHRQYPPQPPGPAAIERGMVAIAKHLDICACGPKLMKRKSGSNSR